MVATRAEAENIERFSDRYRLCCSPVRLDIETQALGADYGSTGHTTRAQADGQPRHESTAPIEKRAGRAEVHDLRYAAVAPATEEAATERRFRELLSAEAEPLNATSASRAPVLRACRRRPRDH